MAGGRSGVSGSNTVRHSSATVPLSLQPGRQTITLTPEAGNFRLTDYGQRDPSLLSFAIRSINLQTSDRAAVIDTFATGRTRVEEDP